jgi:hypothetical protein
VPRFPATKNERVVESQLPAVHSCRLDYNMPIFEPETPQK